MSLDAATGHLGCPIGTLGVPLMRARERLRVKLSRRTLSVPAGLLVAGLSSKSAPAAPPATLVGPDGKRRDWERDERSRFAGGCRVTQQVLRSMVMIKVAKILPPHWRPMIVVEGSPRQYSLFCNRGRITLFRSHHSPIELRKQNNSRAALERMSYPPLDRGRTKQRKGPCS